MQSQHSAQCTLATPTPQPHQRLSLPSFTLSKHFFLFVLIVIYPVATSSSSLSNDDTASPGIMEAHDLWTMVALCAALYPAYYGILGLYAVALYCWARLIWLCGLLLLIILWSKLPSKQAASSKHQAANSRHRQPAQAACSSHQQPAAATNSQQQPAASRKPQAASSKPQAASSKQQAANSSQLQAASSQQPADSSKQAASSSQQQAASSQQQAASSKQRAASSKQQASKQATKQASSKQQAASRKQASSKQASKQAASSKQASKLPSKQAEKEALRRTRDEEALKRKRDEEESRTPDPQGTGKKPKVQRNAVKDTAQHAAGTSGMLSERMQTHAVARDFTLSSFHIAHEDCVLRGVPSGVWIIPLWVGCRHTNSACHTMAGEGCRFSWLLLAT